MTTTREHSLPERRNPYMVEDVPDYADLVNCRALGQTKLTQRVATPKDADSNGLRVFDYAHLRAPLPKGVVSGIFSKGTPNAYFLMRRSSDGYVSATGMFKATFPYADAEDEEAERNYIKSLPATSKEETAGNVWISPDQAIALAEEYTIVPWIRALLDPTDIPLHGPQSAKNTAAASPKVISAPPKYFHGVAPPTPSSIPRASSRARRSASPTKPSSRTTASPRKRSAKALSSQQNGLSETSSTKQSVSPTLSTSQLGLAPTLPVPVPALEPVEEDVVIESLEKEPDSGSVEEEEPKVKIIVDQNVKVDEHGVETTHTSLEVELPLFGEPPSAEETARMVAEAKEMVLAAKNTVSGSASVPGSPSVTRQSETPVKSKRKAEGISVDEQEEANKDTEEQAVENGPRAKKMKTEAEQKRDRVRKRALFGVSATLAVGAASALVPYFMGML